MSPARQWVLQGIRTVRRRTHFSGKSRAACATWALFPVAITARLLPSMTPALLWALQTLQPARTHFPGHLPTGLLILELCRAQMPVQRLPSTIKARLRAVPADMQLCGLAATFRTWARSAALPVKRTASTIMARSSESLTPALVRTLFYGKAAQCRTLVSFQAIPAATLTISMTAEWLWALQKVAGAFALLSGPALPECSH